MRRLHGYAIFTIFLAGACSPPEDSNDAFEPASAVLPRLTTSQYRNTLEDLFSAELPATPVEADTNPYLFYSIGATTTTLSELGAQKYADAATIVSEWAFADATRRDQVMGCAPSSPGDACVEQFVSELGLRLFRRPLTDDERARWTAVATDTAGGDAYQGAQIALYGMLQSPHFLYRVELGEVDPDDASRRRYTSWEMAGRLSFLLWNTAPDAQLLSAAERGELLDDASLYEHASRLLEAPRAQQAIQAFFDQYFELGSLAHVERDPASYPGYTPTLASSMRTEIQLLVDDFVYRRDADIRGLFSTRRTFVNSELAALYQVDAPGASEIAFVPVELPADGPRAGVLTLGAFLTMNAHPTETSPTLRGKYLRERVLCERVPPPPGDIDLNLDDTGSDAPTLRERLEQHRDDPACSACHAFMDPPGFVFEHFDSIGNYRTQVDGYPVDASGQLDGSALDNARDLAELLPDDPRVVQCIVKQVYRHANGRLDVPGDAAALALLEQAFAASGYRFRDLLIDLVVSDSFRTLAAEEVSQ